MLCGRRASLEHEQILIWTRKCEAALVEQDAEHRAVLLKALAKKDVESKMLVQRALAEKDAEFNVLLQKALAEKDLEHEAALQVSSQKTFEIHTRLKELGEDTEQDGHEARPIADCTQYDYIFMFNSLSSFAQTNRFDILRSTFAEFSIDSPQEVRIVGVVGLFDKGKTKMINMLFGKSFRSSKVYTTQGLSFVYVPARKMLVVDTAGVQSTVSFRPQDVEPIVDAQTTEAFLFELISRMSDMLIFVVNDFTWVEQKNVAMFHQKDKLQNKRRELIVLHNLRTTCTLKEAEILFKKQIVSCYEGAESHLSELIYTADLSPAVHHITICKEGSSAGLHYNSKNMEYLMNLLEYGQGGRTRVVLADLLTTIIAELLPKFLLIETVASQWKLGCSWDTQGERGGCAPRFRTSAWT
jgi:hypothetical protein